MRTIAEAQEQWSPTWFSWVGTQPALELLNRIGVGAVHAYDVSLANRFRAVLGLEPSDSAIVSVDLADRAGRLERAGIVAALRGGRLRASWHVHNTDADADAALAPLAPARSWNGTGRPRRRRMIGPEAGGYAPPPMAIAAHPDFADALRHARAATLSLIAPLDNQELARVHHPLMSPLDWDLGHIAAYEDLWIVHRHGGGELLRPELADLYDAFETPRAVRGEIPFLRGRDVFDYIAGVRERALEVLDAIGPGDGTLFELVARHEAQHNETMRQTLFLAGLPGGRPAPAGRRDGGAGADDEWIDVPAGSFELGAGPDGFAYDNERPRHRIEVPAFRIARRPATNGSWMHFCEGGGYERREWWSDEGWAWKEEYDITHPEGWTADGPPPADADRPVMHVSWFEADAFARSQGARLPTEAEWEKASTWTQEPLAQIGEVWEWTASRFRGYPGFVAHPYREYSEVFFGERYRVLRGCSWATEAAVRSPTFRNWDLPQRRQIFAGVRPAKDVIR